MISELRDSDV